MLAMALVSQRTDSGFFGTTTTETASWARAAGVARKFSAEQTVFHQGEVGDAIYIVQAGRFEVRRLGPEGDVLSLRTFAVGEYFGELAVLSPGESRTATVVALESSEALVLHRAVFEHLRSLDHAVDRTLLAETAARLRRFTDEATDFVFLSAEERLVKRLADLADAFTTLDGKPLPLRVTQDGLARMTGVTRQTVNRVLHTLEDAGVIRRSRGAITIRNRGALDTFS
jgi:CRP/FNR family transcriptional regulator, cyclic AMP receptor protein